MKPKIAIIASFAESLLNFRLHLIKAFLARGYEVITIAPDDERVREALSKYHVRFIPVGLDRNGLNPLKDIFLLFKLVRILRDEKPEIVFSYTIKPVIYGSVAAKCVGIKNIYAMLTGTGYIFSKTNLRTRVVGFIAKNMFSFALRFNKKLFFQNKDNAAFFKAHKLIHDKQPIAIINGSGVDINFFAPAPLPTSMSFLMIARLLYDKGVREYVRAAEKVKARFPDVTFKLVGWLDTNPNSITQEELDSWVNAGTIEFLGRLSDVRQAIKESSVYVLPSYGEGTPRTVLEAMAMSRPIITTDVPGCRETVKHNLNGFLVPVTEIDPLSDAMIYFIQNKAAIETMGKASRAIAIEKYDVNKVNQCILQEMNIHDENPEQTILEATR